MSSDRTQPARPAFANGKSRLPRFDGYTGGTVWSVYHPNFGACMVVAPSIPAAIVVAARVWKQTWTEYAFYSECRTTYKGNRKKLTMDGSAVI